MQNIELDLQIYPIWYTPFWKTKTFILIISVFLLITCFTLIYFFAKNRKNLKKVLTVEDLILNLYALKHQLNNKESVFICTQLILILKQFVYLSYKQDFMHQTEDELIEFIKEQDLPNDLKVKLCDLLKQIIMVKFCKILISKIQMEKNIDLCVEFMMTINKNFVTTSNNKTT